MGGIWTKLREFRLDDLKPYENNPRINDNAVGPVLESLKQVGYVTPIIVDEDGVILAGHTRYKALTEKGVESVECIVMEGMTEEQKRKYRILDNKVGELAEWDEELLKGELENLDLGGVDWFNDIINPNIAPATKKMDSDTVDTEVRCPRCGTLIVPGFSEDELPF